MPGQPCVETVSFEVKGPERTRIINETVFFTDDERDGMLASGMAAGQEESYAALEKMLAKQ